MLNYLFPSLPLFTLLLIIEEGDYKRRGAIVSFSQSKELILRVGQLGSVDHER